MTLLPSFEKRDLRERIIAVLASEWPLSARKIFEKVQADFPNITYQGVHKALNKLVAEGTVKKEGKFYSLNPSWVSGLRNFAEGLDKAYSGKTTFPLDELRLKGSISVSFDRIIDFAHFAAGITALLTEKPTRGLVLAHWRHAWNHLTLTKEDYAAFHRIFDNADCYALIGCDTPLDRFLANAFSKFGAHFKFGIDCAKSSDLVVINDYVVSVYFSPLVKKAFDVSSEKMKSPADFDSKEYFDWVHKPGMKVHVTIVKNKPLADQIVEESMRYFK